MDSVETDLIDLEGKRGLCHAERNEVHAGDTLRVERGLLGPRPLKIIEGYPHLDELSAERLHGEIKDAEEDLADAPEDQKRLAQEKVDRLKELKDALKI